MQAVRGAGLDPSIRNFDRFGLVTACNEAPAGAIAAINEAVSIDNEWTRIAPYGLHPNEIGLQLFDRDGARAMVAAFNSVAEKALRKSRGLPVFVGHPDDPGWAKSNPAIRAEAVGRIKALEDREDGLYGRIAWNEAGKGLISGEAAPYAFHSPRWGMLPSTFKGQKVFRPVLLHSIGLTNNPNIKDNVIGLNEAPTFPVIMKPSIIALLAALGRPLANAATVTDEQLAAAVNEATPVATGLVTASNELGVIKPKVAALESEKGSLNTQLVTARNDVTRLTDELTTARTNASNERAARADTVLVVAVNTGKITEAQRAEWKPKLVAPGADFGAVEKEIGALKPAVNTKRKEVGDRKGEAAADREEIDAINEAVMKHIKDKGLDPVKDYNVAFSAVKKAQPALFDATA